MSLQYLKKEDKDKVDLLHLDKYQSFLQVDINTFGIKVSYKLIPSLLIGMIKLFKVLKVTSLQYLYKISKKKLGMEFIFCMQINIKVGIIVFDGSGQACPKYPK